MSYVGFDNPVVNGGGTPTMISGLFADRPVVGYQGLIYISQDTQVIYQWVNGAWEPIGTGTFIPGAGATNGLQILPLGIGLGGTLTQNTGIILAAFGINIGGGTGLTTFGINGNNIDLSASQTQIECRDVTNTVVGRMLFGQGGGGICAFTDDSIVPNGIVYGADYSGTFIDESLVTKRYVDNSITPPITPTLQEVTDAGNTTTNDIVSTGNLQMSTGVQSVEVNGSHVILDDSGTGESAAMLANQISVSTGTITSTITPTTIRTTDALIENGINYNSATPPAINVGSAAGTGSTASITGANGAHQVTVNSGSAATSPGVIATVVLTAAMTGSGPLIITFSPGNDQATQAYQNAGYGQVYMVGTSDSTYNIVVSAGEMVKLNSTYIWNVQVLGTAVFP
jgi:hypothetical protein